MARDFDGANDRVGMGSDASIDSFVTQSVACWAVVDSIPTGSNAQILGKNGNSQWALEVGANDRDVVWFRKWNTGSSGLWISNMSTGLPFADGALVHVVVVHDGGSTANDPTIYVDGASVSVTELSAPSGTLVSDSAQNLASGSRDDNNDDYDGRISHLVYANALWDAAQVNRHRWYGEPGGAVAVKHPWMTDSLTNKGTATANGSATGTTMAGLPRVERNHMSMMGCGR